jgi:hypothetical protein
MSAFKHVRQFSRLGLVFVAAAAGGCGSEPIEEADPPETVSEAVEELSFQGYTGGELVLQDTQLGAWTYEALAKLWLKWAMGLPFSTGPITDPTGDQCDLGQSGRSGSSPGRPEDRSPATAPSPSTGRSTSRS